MVLDFRICPEIRKLSGSRNPGADIVQKVETENSGTADGKRHIDYCCIAAFVF